MAGRAFFNSMNLKFVAVSVVAAFWAASAHARMTPNAPVKDFRVPRFGESGYTQWVLQGGEGSYDSEEQVRVKDMALRVYSGDERMALELNLESPAATIRLKESRAFSEAPIVIEGANFTISGTGWTWEGEKRVIQVKENARVAFTQALADSLSQKATGEADETTVIESTGLRLTTTEDDYKFEFTRDVVVRSEGMTLRSDALMVLADAPEGVDAEDAPAVDAGELESVRTVYAEGNVEIEEAGRAIRADKARFKPREDHLVLEGLPRIETPGVYLSGDRMESRSGTVTVEGSEASGRAQVILLETGGLGLEGGSALAAETIVLAERITMRELEKDNEFRFETKVEVMSGPLQMTSDRMTILSRRDGAEEGSAGDDSLDVGEVHEILAEGEVRIEQDGQFATAGKVVFHPLEQSARLLGSPRVTNGGAVLTGERIELEPETVRVFGNADERVEVSLPELPDLGYDPGLAMMAEDASDDSDEKGAPPKAPTVVSSERLEMVEREDGTKHFTFTESVAVEGTNLEATATKLEVFTRNAPASSGAGESDVEVDRIVASGDVAVLQAGRMATSETATILPEEGKVVLEGKAVVEDDRGKVSGHRLTLLQGRRRALIEGGGPEKQRATIRLEGLPDGEF